MGVYISNLTHNSFKGALFDRVDRGEWVDRRITAVEKFAGTKEITRGLACFHRIRVFTLDPLDT